MIFYVKFVKTQFGHCGNFELTKRIRSKLKSCESFVFLSKIELENKTNQTLINKINYIFDTIWGYVDYLNKNNKREK